MKYLPLLSLLCLLGCATPQPSPVKRSGDNPDEAIGTALKTYEDVFRFIAEHTRMLKMDERTIFRLAADSKIEILYLSQLPTFYLIEANFYAGGVYNQIRGAQFNGNYYVLRSLSEDSTAPDYPEKGFELVGILSGNQYRVDRSQGGLSIVTSWHSSVSERSVMTYTWNGKAFPLSKVEVVGGEPDSPDN